MTCLGENHNKQNSEYMVQQYKTENTKEYSASSILLLILMLLVDF